MCECESCQDSVLAQARRNALMKEYGWVADIFIEDDKQTPMGFNIHTHGLGEKFNHLNFQIVMPMPPETAHAMFVVLVEKLEEGQVFEAEKLYSDIIDIYDITFKLAEETGRKVLRLIVPDKEGNLFPDDLEGNFKKQWE